MLNHYMGCQMSPQILISIIYSTVRLPHTQQQLGFLTRVVVGTVMQRQVN